MNHSINHPYWELHAELLSLGMLPVTTTAKRSIRELAVKAKFQTKDMLKLDLILLLPWFKVRMVQHLFFVVLRERFAYSVLSPEILEFVAACAPLVELAAGNGYNAWLLQQMDAVIVPIDAFPVEEGKNWFFNTRFGLPSKSGQSWMKIEKGTAESVSAYPHHTLLLCWPPKNSMASESLKYFTGNKLILIAEKKCCADTAFFKRLETEWQLEHSTKTNSWPFCHSELLEIYSRI